MWFDIHPRSIFLVKFGLTTKPTSKTKNPHLGGKQGQNFIHKLNGDAVPHPSKSRKFSPEIKSIFLEEFTLFN